jgi:hypothetical protein
MQLSTYPLRGRVFLLRKRDPPNPFLWFLVGVAAKVIPPQKREQVRTGRILCPPFFSHCIFLVVYFFHPPISRYRKDVVQVGFGSWIMLPSGSPARLPVVHLLSHLG